MPRRDFIRAGNRLVAVNFRGAGVGGIDNDGCGRRFAVEFVGQPVEPVIELHRVILAGRRRSRSRRLGKQSNRQHDSH